MESPVGLQHTVSAVDDSPTIMPRIPQEICDKIIDCLSDDSKSLRACGLVCRGWVFSSRRNLFRSVSLVYGKYNRICKFFEILDDPSSLVRDSIRHMQVVILPLSIELGARLRIHRATSSDGFERLVQPLLNRVMATVTHLDLDCHMVPTDDFLHGLHRVFPSVVSFSLLGCKSRDLASMVSLVCTFPSLKELTVHYRVEDGETEYSRWFAEPPVFPAHVVPSSKIRNLQVFNSYEFFNALFMAGFRGPATDTLNLFGLYTEKVSVALTAARNIQSLGNTLKRLAMQMDEFNIRACISPFLLKISINKPPPAACRQINLFSRLNELRCLHLAFCMPYCTSVADTIRVVSPLCAPHLEDLCIDINLTLPREFEDESCWEEQMAAVDGCLARLDVPPTARRTVRMASGKQETRVLEVCSRLRACASRGIVATLQDQIGYPPAYRAYPWGGRKSH